MPLSVIHSYLKKQKKIISKFFKNFTIYIHLKQNFEKTKCFLTTNFGLFSFQSFTLSSRPLSICNIVFSFQIFFRKNPFVFQMDKHEWILTSDVIRMGCVCLPRLKLSSIFPSITATARKSPCKVGPWFIQISKPLGSGVLMFMINLLRFSPRRL